MLGKNRIRKVERITERHDDDDGDDHNHHDDDHDDHDHDHHLRHPETSSSSTSSPKVEGLTDCPKLSVLDLHGNRSYQQFNNLDYHYYYDDDEWVLLSIFSILVMLGGNYLLTIGCTAPLS